MTLLLPDIVSDRGTNQPGATNLLYMLEHLRAKHRVVSGHRHNRGGRTSGLLSHIALQISGFRLVAQTTCRSEK